MSNCNDPKYGKCPCCGSSLEPIWFIDEERKTSMSYMYKTGRKRKAIDCLVCPVCLHEECIDDSFDGPWLDENEWKSRYGETAVVKGVNR